MSHEAPPPAAGRHEGVPDSLTLDGIRQWLEPRVSEKRLRHIAGVADIAGMLSAAAGCDPFLCQLAAWLHDACKEMKDKDLVASAEQSGLKLSELEKSNGHLLHGPVSAWTARIELGVTNQGVLDAVSQHTLGFAPMAPLSQVLFLADCLEGGRPKDYTDPIWQALDAGGSNDFDRATVVACDLGLKHLIDSGRPIHPRTAEVRNYYLERIRRRAKQV